jgi:hypothetical protein
LIESGTAGAADFLRPRNPVGDQHIVVLNADATSILGAARLRTSVRIDAKSFGADRRVTTDVDGSDTATTCGCLCLVPGNGRLLDGHASSFGIETMSERHHALGSCHSPESILNNQESIMKRASKVFLPAVAAVFLLSVFTADAKPPPNPCASCYTRYNLCLYYGGDPFACQEQYNACMVAGGCAAPAVAKFAAARREF